jgi:hypothetical protein
MLKVSFRRRPKTPGLVGETKSKDSGSFFMPRRKQRARPRSLGKKPRPKQGKFIRFYSDPESETFGNATGSAGRAGYKGKPGSNQLAVQGCRLLKNPFIQQEITKELVKQGYTPQFSAQLLMSAAQATKVVLIPNRKGKKVLPCKVADHGVRMQAHDRIVRLFEERRPRPHHLERAVRDAQIQMAALEPVFEKFLSDEYKKVRAEYRSLSPADRMLLCQAFTTLGQMNELAKQMDIAPGKSMLDFVENLEKYINPQAGGEPASDTSEDANQAGKPAGPVPERSERAQCADQAGKAEGPAPERSESAQGAEQSGKPEASASDSKKPTNDGS